MSSSLRLLNDQRTKSSIFYREPIEGGEEYPKSKSPEAKAFLKFIGTLRSEPEDVVLEVSAKSLPAFLFIVGNLPANKQDQLLSSLISLQTPLEDDLIEVLTALLHLLPRPRQEKSIKKLHKTIEGLK